MQMDRLDFLENLMENKIFSAWNKWNEQLTYVNKLKAKTQWEALKNETCANLSW